ncbi:MAG TPA: hypothetical protein DCZ97_02625 [Syntrophus sp. (in: bacteria)]|nr:hypothetical protein [Syntrophus sp. (in: bacteria)]
MFGKPVIKNTRITVEHILRKLSGCPGKTWEMATIGSADRETWRSIAGIFCCG